MAAPVRAGADRLHLTQHVPGRPASLVLDRRLGQVVGMEHTPCPNHEDADVKLFELLLNRRVLPPDCEQMRLSRNTVSRCGSQACSRPISE